MAKPPKKPKPGKIETDPGAWERFEHAVDAAVKSGPKHRMSPPPHKPKQDGGRIPEWKKPAKKKTPNK